MSRAESEEAASWQRNVLGKPMTTEAEAAHRPCARCGEKRDAGIHDTPETCDGIRGPCLDPGRHHPFEAAHRHGRMPPYTDDRGDLQEAWMRGYDAANHDAALAAEPIAASSRLDVETARRVFHDEYNADFGCVHRNQHQASWDCRQRVDEFAAEYERLRATPEPEE